MEEQELILTGLEREFEVVEKKINKRKLFGIGNRCWVCKVLQEYGERRILRNFYVCHKERNPSSFQK